ncbi:hypothetical protein VNI00_004548 [Paramarasmius palmivorus]|uniref:F-box domain-containing protein n=1 Tax=Paramarasmius palmivorus TaxID=297713 RepID=A0AAW0DJL7_9AGAR
MTGGVGEDNLAFDGTEIEDIDQHIISLETQLQELRAQRNLKVPMSRLPVEIMTSIFRFCVSHGRSEPRGTRWLAFTHVCRSWRSIALNHAPLWTCIDFSNMALARMMLERSKNAALDVAIRRLPYGSERQNALDVIQNQVHRVRHLHVSMGHVEFLKVLIRVLTHAAPSLRSLKIVNYMNLDLQSDFLAGEAPLLTDLRLHSTYLSWDSPFLQNLTRLELSGDSWSNLPTGKQFLDALRRMPMLEVLELRQILPRAIEGNEVVSLPNLRELSLEAETDDIEGCAAVLQHITFPVTTTIRVSCFSQSHHDGAFDSVLSQLSSLLSNSPSRLESPRTFKSLWVELETGPDRSYIALDARNTHIPDYIAHEGSLPTSIVHLEFEWDRSGLRVLEEIKAVIGVLPIKSLESLHLRGYSGADGGSEDIDETNGGQSPAANILTKIIEPLLWSTTIKTLALYGSCYAKELAVFLPMLNTSVQPPIEALPSMRTLVLSNPGIHFDDHDEERPFLDQLLGILKSRSEYGRKIEKLVLRSCNGLSREQTVLLRQVAGELDWDFEEMLLGTETRTESPEDEQ